LQAAEAAAAAAPSEDEEEEEEEVQPPPPPPVIERKRRLSKAERRALKTGQAPRVVPKTTKTSFKDSTYINYGDARQEEMDHLLNDTRRDDSAAGAGLQMLEEALLDVAPDEALDMLKRRSMHKWDARKKKYVQQSVSEIIDPRGNKKQKNESGADVKKGATRGELYRKWRERKGADLCGNQPVRRVHDDAAARNRHRHAIEQASHRWRGGQRSAERAVKF
jgi:hypothetical protein